MDFPNRVLKEAGIGSVFIGNVNPPEQDGKVPLFSDLWWDCMVHAVNEGASPLLHHRTWEVLTAITGAIQPIDEPHKWREFWEREKDRLVLVDPAKRRRDIDHQTAQLGAFISLYGVSPETARELAAPVIDRDYLQKRGLI